jgi:hypothetical protein
LTVIDATRYALHASTFIHSIHSVSGLFMRRASADLNWIGVCGDRQLLRVVGRTGERNDMLLLPPAASSGTAICGEGCGR